jgi:cytochrome c553
MTRCGRCKGRREIRKPRGLERIPCPACNGQGVKAPKSSLGSRTVSIPLMNGASCKLCNEPAVQNHHVVSQSRLDRLPKEIRQQAKADPRNALALCYACHHDETNGRAVVELEHLHPDFNRFLTEYGLEGALPRHLRKDYA